MYKSIVFYLILFLGTVWLITACTAQPELEWNEEEGYRWADISTGFFGQTGFSKLTSSQTNIAFRNDVKQELVEENRNYLNGSGVAVADVDGDGFADIYFARLDGPNKLYRNMGDNRFEDITEEAGVSHEGYNSTGVAFADVNGDGDPDLLIASFDSANSLFLNDGNGHFSQKEDSGLKFGHGSTTIALADIDSDGDLDLYITNYKEKSVRDMYGQRELSLNRTMRKEGESYKLIPPFDEHYGIIQTEDGQVYRNEYGEVDELYINDGNGQFTVVNPADYFFDADGDTLGLQRDWGLTAKFHDLNGDGHPDLYVANDFWTPDRFWINRGDGTFKSINGQTIRNYSFSSMGVDFSDINRDKTVDFFVTEMLSPIHQRRMRQLSEHLEEIDGRPQYNRNSLYLNRGDHTYAEISYYSGLEATEWSWATRFLDIDLDGYEDLLITTGHAYDYQDLDTQIETDERTSQSQQTNSILEYPSLELTNKAFRNNGDLSFTDQSGEWGFTESDVAHGMAVADLDNDGDLDVVINRLNNIAAVYQNKTTNPRLGVRLSGREPNTQAIGAKVELQGGSVIQTKEIAAGGDYVSGSDLMVSFAADPDNRNHRLVVTWPDGQKTKVDSIHANRMYVIEEPEASSITEAAMSEDNTEAKPVFEDSLHQIDHHHHENEYDDFRFSPLLPYKLSRQGPGVAWLDITGDGRDNLLVGSGRNGRLAIFENGGKGNMTAVSPDGLSLPAPGDQTAIIGWREDGNTRLVIGSANYEQGDPNAPSAFIYTFNGRQPRDQSELKRSQNELQIKRDAIPGILSTTGPLAAADVDADGYIDLFIGGRFKPGRYPEDADSRLFRNKGGAFHLDNSASRMFSELGLVTGAVFSDLTQNGYPDLLVSTEWGPLRLFENNKGQFREITDEMGLSQQLSGWWQGVATGDFNNDGRPDIVATNMGLNSRYKIRDNHEIRLFYEDVNFDGRLDIIDSYYDKDIDSYVPRRRLYDLKSIPDVLNQVKSHRQFAGSSLDRIFNKDFSRIPYKQINTLEHMVFINTGDKFEPHPLPAEAQFTTGSHVGVADVDNDGNEDLFLSQNFFGFPKQFPRQDAGRGLLLKGDGEGNFIPVDGSESGIKIYGEQRGAAFGDVNEDRKVDLVVTQNSGATKLYINQTTQTGLQVRLIGPPSNQNAFGSGIRIIYEDGSKGPQRELRAGSGYWSQDSPTQVMGLKDEPSAIEIKWFDGSTEIVEVPGGSEEIEISYSAKGN